MTRCSAKTYTTGSSCKNSAREGKRFCYAHKAEEKKVCKAKTVSGERCSKNSVEGLYGLCQQHHDLKDKVVPTPKPKVKPVPKPKVLVKEPKFDHLLVARLNSDKDWQTVYTNFDDHIAGYVLVYDTDGVDATFYSDISVAKFKALADDFFGVYKEEPIVSIIEHND